MKARTVEGYIVHDFRIVRGFGNGLVWHGKRCLGHGIWDADGKEIINDQWASSRGKWTLKEVIHEAGD